jgi:hypothetical protein
MRQLVRAAAVASICRSTSQSIARTCRSSSLQRLHCLNRRRNVAVVNAQCSPFNFQRLKPMAPLVD